MMKNILPPLVAIVFTYLFDRMVDWAFGLGPYDDSGTAGIVFLIEAVMMGVCLVIGYLIHISGIVKVIKRKGDSGFQEVLAAGLGIIAILSLVTSYYVYSDSAFSRLQIVLLGIRFFITMGVLLGVDLLTLKLLNKYGA